MIVKLNSIKSDIEIFYDSKIVMDFLNDISKIINLVDINSFVENYIGDGDSGVDFKFFIEVVIIVKAGGLLGFSIVGGSDYSSYSFGMEEFGVFVFKIVFDGVVFKIKLKIGDRILSVNNRDVTSVIY